MPKMTDKEEQWIDNVLASVEQLEKAKPKDDLFERIQAKVDQLDAKIVPMKHWRRIAAAVAIILISNVYIINQYNSPITEIVETRTGDVYDGVVTNYNLYDE
ncbi:MAG: hypothetical protein ACI8XB_001206 [Patiriisocius sp.]|jgi:hypothetical protein